MLERFKVFVHSEDPILLAGMAAQFRGVSTVVVTEDLDEASVALVVADRIDEAAVQLCIGLRRLSPARIVLVASQLGEEELIAGVEAGACAFLRRIEATPDRLATVVAAAAAGDGSVPGDLIGSLLLHFTQLRHQVDARRGITLSGFTERELEVLRLVAEGFETSEIAHKLCYSERTVKGVIHEINSRFQLKNRAQAVAYAVRQGVI